LARDLLLRRGRGRGKERMEKGRGGERRGRRVREEGEGRKGTGSSHTFWSLNPSLVSNPSMQVHIIHEIHP